MRGRLCVIGGLLLAASQALASEGAPLTLDDVIGLSRAQTPSVRVARARVREAEAGLVGARALQAENPTLGAALGPRWTGRRTTDIELGLSVPIELGGKRSRRIQVAESAATHEKYAAAETGRHAAGGAVAAYFQALHAERVLALAQERVALAEELARTAVARQQAGDIAPFEVNLAEAEIARASSQVASARAQVARARAELAATLGVESLGDRRLAGDLADRSRLDARSDAGEDLPGVKAARAGIALAAAERALADTGRWPELSLRVTYAQEEDAELVVGGFSVTLPIFERGQGARARARARQALAQVELEGAQRAAAAATEGARAAHASAVEAVEILQTKGQPKAIANEAMARESYRAGKIDLAALLLIRRDALDTRREYVDRLLEAALAAADLWVAVGAP